MLCCVMQCGSTTLKLTCSVVCVVYQVSERETELMRLRDEVGNERKLQEGLLKEMKVFGDAPAEGKVKVKGRGK